MAKGAWNSCRSTSSRGSRCITRLNFGHRKLLYECNASTACHCLGKLLVSPIDSTRSQTMLTQRPQWLAAMRSFHPPKTVLLSSFHFRDEKPTEETNAPENYTSVSKVSHVMPSQTVPQISNSKERFNT